MLDALMVGSLVLLGISLVVAVKTLAGTRRQFYDEYRRRRQGEKDRKSLLVS